MGLPATGEISYNGYTFPAETETTGIDARAVLDQAKRTVSHVVYNISLRWFVLGGSNSIGTTMNTLKQQLLAQAGELVYSTKGFGDFSINTSTIKDVMWGPIPRSFRFKPKGRDNAAECNWTVEVAVPTCSAAVYEGAIMEFNYRASYEIDRGGYTTRNVSGYLRIPQTRATQGTRTLSDSADAYRERFVPAAPEGFRRERQTFTIDESKSRLDFSYADVQMALNIPPAGVIEVTANHSVSITQPNSFAQWQGTISATYEVARDKPRGLAFAAFVALFNSRIQAIKANEPARVISLLAFSMNEPQIYGKQAASFSVTYVTTGTIRLLTDGLWQPVPGSNWSQWAASLGNTAFNVRGFSKLRLNPADDVIIDLCQERAVTLRPGGLPGGGSGGTTLRQFDVAPPQPQNSWLVYNNKLVWEQHEAVLVHRPLAPQAADVVPSPSTALAIGGPVAGAAAAIFRAVANNVQPQPADRPSLIQRRAAPLYACRLVGNAVRVGFEIPQPVLSRIGNQQAVPANLDGDGFSQWISGNNGQPVYSARWSLRYVFPASPGTLGTPPNAIDPSTSTTLRTRT